MGLLSPWFLGGLALLGLPIYLHLLQRARAIEMAFSSAMFFEAAIEVSRRERRLMYIALLILRLLLLALLALAFAKPYWQMSPAAAAQSRLAIIVLDRTASMAAANRYDAARRQAAELIRGLPGGTAVRAIGLGVTAEMAERKDASRDELAATVAALPVTAGSAPLVEAIRLASATAESEGRRADVHIFSDFQRSASGDALAFAASRNLKLIPHAASPVKAANLWVESVQAPRIVYTGDAVRLTATIAGLGNSPAPVSASLVRGAQIVETKQVLVPADGRASVEFIQLAPAYGPNSCSVRIASPDALPADNELRFVVERGEAQRLLYLHESLDQRSPLYVQSAVAAGTAGAFAVDAARRDGYLFNNLKRYGVVVLADPGPLGSGAEAELKRYVNQGGSLWILAGPSVIRAQKVPVAGVRVTGSLYAARENQLFLSPARLDTTHPLLRSLESFQTARIYQAAKFDPGPAQVLARLNDESPLIAEFRSGQGRIVVFATTLDNISNDLPVSPLFVPLVTQTVQYLAGSADLPNLAALGEVLELRNANDPAGTVDVTTPEGAHPLSIREAATVRAYRPMTEGVYALKGTAGRTRYVAVNLDRKESDLSSLTPEDLTLWSGGSTVAGPASSAAAPEAERNPLWPWVLAALAVAAVAESWLAARYLSVRRDALTPTPSH
jgi:hypothetical protein